MENNKQIDTEGILHLFIKCSTILLWQLSLSIVIYFIIVGLCLLVRHLRIRFGKKIKPCSKKAILITGATSGIGLALAKQFYRLGFTVIAGYYDDNEPGHADLLQLSFKPFRALPRWNIFGVRRPSNPNLSEPFLFLTRMDVRSHESIVNSRLEVEGILDKYQLDLHALINNAAISREGPFEWSDVFSLKNVVDTNLSGQIMVAREFIQKIIESKGRIINVSSGLVPFPGPCTAVYGSTKAAVAHFSECLHADLIRYGSACYTVMPSNLLLSTDILYGRVKSVQESSSRLSDEQKELYKDSINNYTKGLYCLLAAKLERESRDLEQVSEAYKISIPDLSQYRALLVQRSLVSRLLKGLFDCVSGGSDKASVDEETGVAAAFESAVRLRSPPRRLYAGPLFFSSVSGPFNDYLPSVICRLMGGSVIDAMLHS